MDEQHYSRRAFLRTAAGSLLGAGTALVAGGVPAGRSAALSAALPRGRSGGPFGTSRGASRDDALPPRTVGLRTLGGDFRFDPPGLRLAPGETVTWLNMGDFHTTSAFHPDNSKLLGGDVPLRIPQGAEPWHSGMLGLTAGTQFRYTTRVEGVYDYFCQPHYGFGMVGRFVVGEPRGGPAATRPLSELNDEAREEMPAVETITGDAGRAYEWTARINGLLFLRANGRPVTDAVSAVRRGVEADDTLAGVLEAAGGAASFRKELDALLRGFEREADYEKLTARADRVKDPLARALDQSRGG